MQLGGQYHFDQPVTVGAGNTLNLDSSFTIGDDRPLRSGGGTVRLVGSLDNTGKTLALDDSTGSWTLAGGTILGGTIAAGGSARLLATPQGGLLDGVTLQADLDIADGASSITFRNGLTLDGATITLGFDDQLRSDGTQVLGGTGEVVFGPDAARSVLMLVRNDSTLTVDSGITIHGGALNASITDAFTSAVIGRSDRWGGATSNANLVLKGTVAGDAADRTLMLRTFGTTTIDGGTVKAADGGRLNVTSLAGNLGANASAVDGGTLQLGGNFVIDAPLTVGAASTLNLESTFTLAGDQLVRGADGTVRLVGTLDNTGKTLLLDDVTGSWTLAGGTITGGTVAAAAAPVCWPRRRAACSTASPCRPISTSLTARRA